jgi:hypothetical protein
MDLSERDRAIKAVADLNRWDVPPKVREQSARHAVEAIEAAGLTITDRQRGAVDRLRAELADEKAEGAEIEAIVDRVLQAQPGAMDELREWAAGTDHLRGAV